MFLHLGEQLYYTYLEKSLDLKQEQVESYDIIMLPGYLINKIGVILVRQIKSKLDYSITKAKTRVNSYFVAYCMH